MKVITLLGTRPEIIRMASIIKELINILIIFLYIQGKITIKSKDKFLDDLDLRYPDIQLDVKSDTLHGQISNIINQTGFFKEKPDVSNFRIQIVHYVL